MPLIKPVNLETVSVRAKLPKALDTEIEHYIKWAGVTDKEFFLVEAAKYLLKMDKDWRVYKDTTSN
ncbi:MAG TPA: hypothetical protein VG895_00525 [Patescibacteria group bacterium]|nr:hypothetical protein [Gammaproteobacteria bacterium]HWA51527.1 hypothetical protein [Patescibacteria group bacterium]